MSFTGTRIENGMITWNVKKPSVSWPATGNVTQTFVSKPGNKNSRTTLAQHRNVLYRSALSLMNEKKALEQQIGRSYGQEKMPWNNATVRKRKSRKNRKSRKVSRR